jgi:peptide/nickel transport system permease protein
MKGTVGYWRMVWNQFRKNKPALVSLYLLIALLIISIFSDLIANKQPLYARYHGRNFYPAFQALFHKSYTDSVINPQSSRYEKLQFDITDWRSLSLDKVMWAPIPYSPSQSDHYNMDYIAPGGDQHYKNSIGELVPSPYILKHHLGTNRIGQDVASGLVHGIGIAFRVGLISMGIAAFFGILLGAVAGYFGDRKIRIRRGSFMMAIPGLFLGYFYGFVVRSGNLKEAFHDNFLSSTIQLVFSCLILFIVAIGLSFTGSFLKKISWFGKKVYFPLDILISRFIEIFDSMPALLLIITISSLFIEKSLGLIMVIIGILAAPHIARLTRAEFLRIRNLDYVQSARALGFNSSRIIVRHMLPNALAPVFVYIAFGVAAAIIAESSLSFLGIGVPQDIVTWGSLLSYARDDYNAWWMVVFPGIAIFITVMMYNLIGEGLRDALDPRIKV